MSKFKNNPTIGLEALADLFVLCFSPSELTDFVLKYDKQLIPDIPPEGEKHRQRVNELVEALDRREALGSPFFEKLRSVRPRRRADIDAVQAHWPGTVPTRLGASPHWPQDAPIFVGWRGVVGSKEEPIEKAWVPMLMKFERGLESTLLSSEEFVERVVSFGLDRAVVVGRAGAGKSTLCRYLLYRANERGIRCRLITLHGLQSLQFQAMVREFADMTVEDERFVLLVDGLDEVNWQADLSSALSFASRLSIVIFTRDFERLYQTLPQDPRWIQARIQPLNDETIEALCQRAFAADGPIIAERVVEARRRPELSDFLSRPLYVLLAGPAFVRVGNEALSDGYTLSGLLETVHEQLWERIPDDYRALHADLAAFAYATIEAESEGRSNLFSREGMVSLCLAAGIPLERAYRLREMLTGHPGFVVPAHLQGTGKSWMFAHRALVEYLGGKHLILHLDTDHALAGDMIVRLSRQLSARGTLRFADAILCARGASISTGKIIEVLCSEAADRGGSVISYVALVYVAAERSWQMDHNYDADLARHIIQVLSTRCQPILDLDCHDLVGKFLDKVSADGVLNDMPVLARVMRLRAFVAYHSGDELEWNRAMAEARTLNDDFGGLSRQEQADTESQCALFLERTDRPVEAIRSYRVLVEGFGDVLHTNPWMYAQVQQFMGVAYWRVFAFEAAAQCFESCVNSALQSRTDDDAFKALAIGGRWLDALIQAGDLVHARQALNRLSSVRLNTTSRMKAAISRYYLAKAWLLALGTTPRIDLALEQMDLGRRCLPKRLDLARGRYDREFELQRLSVLVFIMATHSSRFTFGREETVTGIVRLCEVFTGLQWYSFALRCFELLVVADALRQSYWLQQAERAYNILQERVADDQPLARCLEQRFERLIEKRRPWPF